MALCIFLFCALQTLLRAINFGLERADADRLVTRHAVEPRRQPAADLRRAHPAVPGVKRVATSNWFGGLPSGRRHEPRLDELLPELRRSTPSTYLAMHPEFVCRRTRSAAFMADRRGALVGRRTSPRSSAGRSAATSSWRATIPPYRVGKPFEFIVRGIYRRRTSRRYPNAQMQLMFFHYKYLYEATGQRTRRRHLQRGDRRSATGGGDRARRSTRLFENSDAETKTETEAAFAAELRRAWPATSSLLLNGIGTGRRLHDPAGDRQHDEHGGARATHGDRGAEDARLLERAGDGAGAGRGGRDRRPRRRARRRAWPHHDSGPAEYPGSSAMRSPASRICGCRSHRVVGLCGRCRAERGGSASSRR